MPNNREVTQAKVKRLRQDRRKKGLCIQCGVPTLKNPLTEKPYSLCGLEAKNCRGANNASSNRLHHRKKERAVPDEQKDNVSY